MAEKFIKNKIFKKIDYSSKRLIVSEFDNCTFINCIFINADLSDITFSECAFYDCNFSNTKIENTSLKDVQFKTCKLLGLNFNDCNKFLLSVYFEECILNLTSFYKLKLKGTQFKNCNLRETDFTETDLTNAIFDNCDMSRATFIHTILYKTDFFTAYNYSIDPEINRIKKAKFSREGVIGLLDKYDIEISL